MSFRYMDVTESVVTTPRVYLAGPIANAVDGGWQWREDVQARFPSRFAWVNPLDDYDGGDILIVNEGDPTPSHDRWVSSETVIKHDKELIRGVDALLVRFRDDLVSAGTDMEMLYGSERRKVVAVWADDDVPRYTWRDGHCDIWSSELETCLSGIEQRLQRKRAYD